MKPKVILKDLQRSTTPMGGAVHRTSTVQTQHKPGFIKERENGCPFIDRFSGLTIVFHSIFGGNLLDLLTNSLYWFSNTLLA